MPQLGAARGRIVPANNRYRAGEDVFHANQAPPPLWSRHSPSNGPCMTRSWTNIGLLACRRVVCDTCVLKPPSPAAVGAAGTGCTAQECSGARR
jgi:hypothetical protein